MSLYILDKNKKIVPVFERTVWREWFSDINNRLVNKTTIDDVVISTVFLGKEHDGGMFETMIFCDGHDLDQNMWRCNSYESAIKQHTDVVNHIKHGTEIREQDEQNLFDLFSYLGDIL